jgi:hypothetical protein
MAGKIPNYHSEKGNIVKLIVFTSLFALVFINIYTPFGSERWYHVSKLRYFFYSSLIILTGVLVVVISRIIMYHVHKKYAISYWQYGLWIAAEIFFMSLFYTIYTHAVNTGRDIVEIFKQSVTNTSLVLLLPYCVSWLYLSWNDKSKRLNKLQETVSLDKNAVKMIPFKDEKGDLRLTVSTDNLLFLEAADNYVNIKYLNKGKVSGFMLRNSLKNLEKTFSSEHKMLVRCHRSYMVNMGKVKIMRREKDGIYLELDGENVKDIPVSGSYIARLTELFLSN